MIDPFEYTILIKKIQTEEEILFVAEVKELPDLREYAYSYTEAYELAVEGIQMLYELAQEMQRDFPRPETYQTPLHQTIIQQSISGTQLMANSPRIKQALTEVFAELSAMTPTQLNAQLEQREIGAVGQLLLDAAAFADSRPEPTKGTNKVVILTKNLTPYLTKVREFFTSPSQGIARELKPNYTANSPYA